MLNAVVPPVFMGKRLQLLDLTKPGKTKYRIAGKFGELSVIHQIIKPSKSELTINNVLTDLLIGQTFLPNVGKEKFTKLSHYTVILVSSPDPTCKGLVTHNRKV